MEDHNISSAVSRVASAFLAASAAEECSKTLTGLAFIIATARKNSATSLNPSLLPCLQDDTFGDVLRNVLLVAGFDVSGHSSTANTGTNTLAEYDDQRSLLAQKLCVRASEVLQKGVGAETLNALR